MKRLFKTGFSVPSLRKRVLDRQVILAGIVSIAALLPALVFFAKRPLHYSDAMIEAARLMDSAVEAAGSYCEVSGVGIDYLVDPNRTGLIGPEYTGLTTTIGHLEAKRTTTNPDFAALIVHLLERAGVTAGDTIAVGCSASFPALMIASVTAVRALDAYPVVIISLGASSFGRTEIDFNLLDLYNLMLRKEIFTVPPAAVSVGGEDDIGSGFESDINNRLIQIIRESGVRFIYEPDLRHNVEERMDIYEGGSSGGRIEAFINTGGSYANLGISPHVLDVRPGLNMRITTLPPRDQRGVLFEMAARGIPVIHLLYIKGLSMNHGLPWDPVPLPETGESELIDEMAGASAGFFITAAAYFTALFVLARRRKTSEK
ncbi:poly-gamma-glutamate system protein [candidate division KSB1 bacterium]